MEYSTEILKIKFSYTTVINYSIQQNNIPTIRELVIENISSRDLKNVEVNIETTPKFSNLCVIKLDMIHANQSINVEVKNFLLDPKLLSELTEKISGEIELKIYNPEEHFFGELFPIEILAFDQWNGLNSFPELLTSFVTPNHPDIAKIIISASSILEQWSGNPSFDSYQSMSIDRVKKQIGSIYESIVNLGLVYCIAPASFENEGQRVRTCDSILTQKLANCLDISLLFASCLEAVGLNAIIVVLKGHAFIGAWLINDTFIDIVNYDITELKKRLATGINEIILIEATCMNAGQNMTFDMAINEAVFKLVKEENFILSIDVKRARLVGILPLPQRISTENGWQIIADNNNDARKSLLPEELADLTQIDEKVSTVLTKQKLWERKLLDLSLRNNLLNLRITQSTIQLLSESLNTFEDALADGDEFQILAKPTEWNNSNIRSGVYQEVSKSDPIIELIKSDLSHKKLRTYLSESDLKQNLIKLYRTSRISLEENGANTLYLALGFLKWFETQESELARYAPILLLPIEIIRKSAQFGYVIRSREEDTIINITLLEKLKQDFGIFIKGLDELPCDNSGVDVTKVFNIIRRDIMSQARWDVEEHAFIGIFSFNKFIMWNDINKNSDKLKENKIVASLISGKLEWQEKEDPFHQDLNTKFNSSDVLLPLSADSSQIEAILDASENKSFVLHGPPGTGKSQTITNIIANALYSGKKVLFVAEKMAALSVVQKRLAEIGLSPFCLELHSNKTKKSLILEHLKKTTEVVKSDPNSEFIVELQKLRNQRKQIVEYVDTLHKKYPFGYSLFDCITAYSEIEDVSDEIKFEQTLIQGLSKDRLVTLFDSIEELQNAGTLSGHPFNHPLKFFRTKVYSQTIRNQSQELFSKYLVICENRKLLEKQILDLFEIDNSILNAEKHSIIIKLIELVLSLIDLPKELFTIETPERNYSNISKLAKHGINRDNYREDLLKIFTKDVLQYNAETKYARWKEESKKWFLAKLFGQRKILKELQGYSIGGKVSKDQVSGYLEKLISYQNEQHSILSSQFSKILDFLWNDGNADWNIITEQSNYLSQIHEELNKLLLDYEKVNRTKIKIASLLSVGTKTFMRSKGEILLKYKNLTTEQSNIENRLNQILDIDFSFTLNDQKDFTNILIDQTELWLNNIDKLKDWTSWLRVKEEIINLGLISVVELYEHGKLENSEVLKSFKRSIYRNMAEYILSKENLLSEFNGKLFEGKIKMFKDRSKYFEELTKKQLFTKIASRIPNFTQEASVSSEIGILQKAIRNNGRATSLRKIFDSIPNLLPRLCPCMLMSPISVAQFFEVDSSKFDIVIFDEASQMPTSEAVGAIARGQSLIVVGDPKQMPPTNFFSINNFDEENADKEDQESILDDCLAISTPSKYLLWHYRSKHESLIAFSNSNFYDNKLLTFPSPDDISTKVTNIYVPGFYDRGKSRQNSAEARAIVKEVIERLSNPELSQKSIGIVTFSAAQQNLIDDLLNDEFKKYPDLEKIAFESSEPIFIKNLENVQGDERDIILFSVGYGPDKDGKIYMQFGPLIRNGGWRRLNVAISRARYEMKVFSTLRSSQIDITRSTSAELIKIKSFLEFTENGRITNTRKISSGDFNKHLELKVANDLRKLGYQVQTNLGCSGFQIDLAIVHPEKNDQYVLGVLTDGYNYLSSRTVIDREIIQPNVLKLLGWNIYKFWTIDWWDNSGRIVEEIIRYIIKASSPSDLNVNSINDQTENHIVEPLPTNPISDNLIQSLNTAKSNKAYYKTSVLTSQFLFSPEEFFSPSKRGNIVRQIQNVLELEAPISFELLSKKIVKAWNLSRLGVRLSEYLSMIYKEMKLKRTSQLGTYFYWNTEQDPEHYNLFRIPEGNMNKREFEDIAIEEISNAIIEILRNEFSQDENNLIKQVAKVFGYNRYNNRTEEIIKTAIDYSINKQRIVIQSDKLLLKQEN